MVDVDAVIDASNVATPFYRTASRFFTEATRQLVAAERTAGVGHHVSQFHDFAVLSSTAIAWGPSSSRRRCTFSRCTSTRSPTICSRRPADRLAAGPAT